MQKYFITNSITSHGFDPDSATGEKRHRPQFCRWSTVESFILMKENTIKPSKL